MLQAPHPTTGVTYDHNTLLKENEHLKQQLRHMHDALATSYTPGHEALKARCDNAEATVKVVRADARAAVADGATARAETQVIKTQLEEEIAARGDAQRLLREKDKELEELNKEMKGLQQRECASKKKVVDSENMLKQTKDNLTKIEQKATEMKEEMKALGGQARKSAAEEKKLERKTEKMQRVADTARAACKVLEDKLKKERASAKEMEKELHNRVEGELAHVKRVEDERNEWKRKAEMTARRLKMEEERSTRLGEVHRTYTLPLAPPLLDRNNDALLSPAPLAEEEGAEAKSPDSESRSRFTSLPFATNEESTDGIKPSGKRITRSKVKSDSRSVVSKKRKSADNEKPLAVENGTRKSSRLGKGAPTAEKERRVKSGRRKGKVESGEQPDTSDTVELPSPRKRRKVESDQDKKADKTTKKTAPRQTKQSVQNRSKTVERNTTGRVLRSQRQVSYNNKQKRREFPINVSGVEENAKVVGRKRVRQAKK